MLREYITNTLARLTENGRRRLPHPALMETVNADIAGLLNELYKEGAISVHGNVNGVKIITWKGGGDGAGSEV